MIKPDLIDHVLAPDPAEGAVRRARSAEGLRLRQPDRQVRDRRPDGRRRPHRPQDHRRHLRRRRPARRRRLLRQGSDEGRPLRRLRRPVRREEHRRRRSRRPLPDPGCLRDRRRPSVLDPRRDLRHRACPRDPDRGARPTSISTCAPPRSSATSTCSGRSTRKTAAYGHFGREDDDFTWERTDKADALAAAAGVAARAAR